MIPLQIKLRNFLSYGDFTQTVSFEPYHLICLSGKNGHGKSALLDAMTWALWGQARKTLATAKADEGLLRLGQTHMMVTFDFLCNGKKYRVQREFVSQQNRSHSDLYFGIASADAELFNSLTEKTTRATQEKIIATIGLSYESCINSIFLRQGQSNEFSSKSAKERKEILATILGINRYEEIRTKAQEKVRTLNASQEQLKNVIQHAQDIVLQKKSLQEQSVITEHELSSIEQQQKELQKTETNNKSATELLNNKIQQKIVLEARLQDVAQLFQKKYSLIITTRDTVRALRRKISIVPFSETEKQKLIDEEALWHERRDELFTIKESLLAAQTAQAEYSQKLTTRYHEQLLELTAAAQKQEQLAAPLTAQQESLKKEVQEKKELIAKHEQTLDSLKKLSLDTKIQTKELQFERRKQFYHTWVDRGNRLNQRLKELQQKQVLGDGVISVTCPLCEQALSSTRKRFLVDKFIHQETVAAHQKNRLTRLVPHLKEILIQSHTELTTLKQQHEQTQLVTVALDTFKNEIEILHNKCLDGEEKLKVLQLELALARDKQLQFQKNKENFFAADKEFQTLLQQSTELQKKISAHFYDQKKHDQIKELITAMKKQEELQKHHAEHRKQHEQEKKNFFLFCAELKTVKQQQTMLMQEFALYAPLALEEELLKKNKADVEQQQKQLTEASTVLLQKKSVLEQQIKTVIEREQELARYQKQIKEYESESDDYQVISQALGKNGIQALLIETAIPELEYEANLLLSKLTDNQSHIMIESVRDLKSGGFKETLDIKISDAVGTRSYELFSGGEAFRIDFALRIALSKLLARRSGASLQTLIIDEGFGSQDEEGLSRIMESLYKIQDDFAKIIIVSHLPEMKNQFPTHFFIHKGSTGSQVAVFEQG